MVRQGIFTVGYMGLMPMFSAAIRDKVHHELIADFFSACVSGFVVGVATAPFNVLRFERQLDFHKPNAPTKRYASLLERAITPNGDLHLFRGWQPRVLMSSCSMFLLHKGKKVVCEQMSDEAQLNLTSNVMR